jgi:hypothetical protein
MNTRHLGSIYFVTFSKIVAQAVWIEKINSICENNYWKPFY